MATEDYKKVLWVGFAHAAMTNYVVPEEIEDHDALVDDMIAVASIFADGMLDEYEDRFEAEEGEKPAGSKRRPAKRSRRAAAEETED